VKSNGVQGRQVVAYESKRIGFSVANTGLLVGAMKKK